MHRSAEGSRRDTARILAFQAFYSSSLSNVALVGGVKLDDKAPPEFNIVEMVQTNAIKTEADVGSEEVEYSEAQKRRMKFVYGPFAPTKYRLSTSTDSPWLGTLGEIPR